MYSTKRKDWDEQHKEVHIVLIEATNLYNDRFIFSSHPSGISKVLWWCVLSGPIHPSPRMQRDCCPLLSPWSFPRAQRQTSSCPHHQPGHSLEEPRHRTHTQRLMKHIPSIPHCKTPHQTVTASSARLRIELETEWHEVWFMKSNASHLRKEK